MWMWVCYGVFVCRSSSPRSFLKSICSSECLVVAFLCLHFSTHHFMNKSAFKDDSTAWVSQPATRLAYKAWGAWTAGLQSGHIIRFYILTCWQPSSWKATKALQCLLTTSNNYVHLQFRHLTTSHLHLVQFGKGLPSSILPGILLRLWLPLWATHASAKDCTRRLKKAQSVHAEWH